MAKEFKSFEERPKPKETTTSTQKIKKQRREKIV